jgi:RNA polymerase sigma factor (sigma-70 family)
MTEQELIRGCKAQERSAQKMLFEQYAPVLLGICRRYVKQAEDAEDVMLGSFYKILSNIEQYQGKGSFEGWMKRISVNESLMFLRKKHNFNLSIDQHHLEIAEDALGIEEQLFEEDILDILDSLPIGYRTVFNLYVIDGLKHREIAEELGISINTSKSQLIQAKRKLASLLKKNKLAFAG